MIARSFSVVRRMRRCELGESVKKTEGCCPFWKRAHTLSSTRHFPRRGMRSALVASRSHPIEIVVETNQHFIDVGVEAAIEHRHRTTRSTAEH